MTDLTKFLNTEGADIEEGNDAAGFFVVQFTNTTGGYMIMTQEGLIALIIESMVLDVYHSNKKSTPCMRDPITKDLDGDTCSEYFSYPSIVGKLMYLAGHSRHGITYILIQVARFTLCPKCSNEAGLKFIVR